MASRTEIILVDGLDGSEIPRGETLPGSRSTEPTTRST